MEKGVMNQLSRRWIAVKSSAACSEESAVSKSYYFINHHLHSNFKSIIFSFIQGNTAKSFGFVNVVFVFLILAFGLTASIILITIEMASSCFSKQNTKDTSLLWTLLKSRKRSTWTSRRRQSIWIILISRKHLTNMAVKFQLLLFLEALLKVWVKFFF